MQCLMWLLFGLAYTNTINASEILAITPIPGTSHWNLMSSVLEVLIDRGHKVTIVSSFPRKTPHENYTHIDLSKSMPIVMASPWETVKIKLFKCFLKSKTVANYPFIAVHVIFYK
jgi:glucuronosyltransferase